LTVADDVNATKLQQTEPPSVPIIDLFPDGGPLGEIQDYSPLTDWFELALE
jgi:hypothetical protein